MKIKINPKVFSSWLKRFASNELVSDTLLVISFEINNTGILCNHQNDMRTWTIMSKLQKDSSCFVDTYPEIKEDIKFCLADIKELVSLLRRFGDTAVLFVETDPYPVLRIKSKKRVVQFPLMASYRDRNFIEPPDGWPVCSGKVAVSILKASVTDAQSVLSGKIVFRNEGGELAIAGGNKRGRLFIEKLGLSVEGLDSSVAVDAKHLKEILSYTDSKEVLLQLRKAENHIFLTIEETAKEFSCINLLATEKSVL